MQGRPEPRSPSLATRTRPTRRLILHAAGLGAVAALTTACDALSTRPDGARSDDRSTKGKEAPGLAKLVRSGELPSVEKRLPRTPLQVEPVDRIGQYGGEWTSGILGPADTVWISRTIDYENLLSYTADAEIVPNVAESYEIRGDGRQYVFHLREGMRWSDGELFTADDIMFWYDAQLRNDELSPVPPQWMVSGGELGTVEKLDEYTVSFGFTAPHGLFPLHLASGFARIICALPKHFAKEFHPEFNPEAEQLAKNEGYDSWIDFFAVKTDPFNSTELPTLRGWTLATGVGEGTRAVFERNPYYWKVDPDGSQLPYIDRVVYALAQDAEALLLRAMNGEIGMMNRHFNTLPNKPVLARKREAGRFGFFTLKPLLMNTTTISLNLTHTDPVKREIFRNRDFRIGLSYAINRGEIIDSVFQRQGEPWQAAPRPECDLFDEAMAKQFTEYDPDRANEHLDSAGYTERDSGGYRLGPDGNRIAFSVEVNNYRPDWANVAALIKEHWKAVGINLSVKNEDRSLYDERVNANLHDAAIWEGQGGDLPDLIGRPEYYFPHSQYALYAPLWAQWYTTAGKVGEEPPAPTMEQLKIFDEVR